MLLLLFDSMPWPNSIKSRASKMIALCLCWCVFFCMLAHCTYLLTCNIAHCMCVWPIGIFNRLLVHMIIRHYFDTYCKHSAKSIPFIYIPCERHDAIGKEKHLSLHVKEITPQQIWPMFQRKNFVWTLFQHTMASWLRILCKDVFCNVIENISSERFIYPTIYTVCVVLKEREKNENENVEF